MPLPTKWNQKRKKPPAGFDYVEPVLEVLENELRDKVKESNMSQRKIESLWPIHQINWQKSRYIYDMYYTYQRISRDVYQYCIDQKLVDAALIAKWKKPGYERLCSTYVINPSNYKFGTTSICRVPFHDRNEDQKYAKDPTTGCMGCASSSIGNSGNGSKKNGNKQPQSQNIFGTKYGQNLAAVQIAREKRMELKRQQELEKLAQEQLRQQQQQLHQQNDDDDDDDDAETDDDDDDDDYGPAPTAGIWAGSQKLQHEIEQSLDAEHANDDDDAPTDDEDAEENNQDDHSQKRPDKKIRT
jgi:bud site selection protein 31